MIKWTAIDYENLPSLDEEVLAANFKPGTYGYGEKLVGHLYFDEENQRAICDSDQALEDVTHFVMVHDFDIEPKEEKK